MLSKGYQPDRRLVGCVGGCGVRALVVIDGTDCLTLEAVLRGEWCCSVWGYWHSPFSAADKGERIWFRPRTNEALLRG